MDAKEVDRALMAVAGAAREYVLAAREFEAAEALRNERRERDRLRELRSNLEAAVDRLDRLTEGRG